MSEQTTPKTGWERLPIVDPVERLARPVEGNTFIRPAAVFDGTLRLSRDLCIDSHFSGRIVTDGTLVVSPSGSIEGDIFAREVLICGAVVGDVDARRQFTLRATGRLIGDVESACIEIENYAFFNGRTKMTRPAATARAEASAAKASTRATPPIPAAL